MSLTSSLAGIAWRSLRWAAGCESAARTPTQPGDDLEPYCAEDTLIQRQRSAGTLDAGVERAVRKIGARYGAEL